MKLIVPFRNFANASKIIFLMDTNKYTMYRNCSCDEYRNTYKAMSNTIYYKE
jgi:hypothetical protein